MISYRPDFSCWWPDYDANPEGCYRLVLKNISDVMLTVGACRQRRTVVQAGGHAGLWPRELAKHFERVHTFEPDPFLHECLKKNAYLPNVTCHSEALGSSVGEAELAMRPTAGSATVCGPVLEWGAMPVSMVTVDSLGLTDLDALILDVEAHEEAVLCGATDTIMRCYPVVHVEELPRSREGIKRHMRHLGYRQHRKVHGDVIYLPPE